MALSEREISIMKAMAEEFRDVLEERDKKHASAMQEQALRIGKLESEVEGLISLLGE
ncbi:antitermination protein NusG [Salmonella enterica subsp. enterica]|nr:antitermination protein NusG [Salmonella enterica]EAT2223402.1 antitermination protein NusG [Salmonella enterica]ECG1137027.1 antitermination protein NusG [Salmonella enterica subsp. enterica]EEO5743308.1 antitermination protein NusG [Salmonella enterica]